jgi:hypothetical protein
MNKLLGSAAIAAALSLMLAGSASAATTVGIGNPIVPGTTVDLCKDCTYLLGKPFDVNGYKVTDYSFYAMNAGDITPLLFTRSNPDATFTLVGIGTARTVTAAAGGPFNFAFGLTAGTDITTANTYFGFANNGGPLVAFSHTGGLGDGGTFLLAPQLALNESKTVDASGYKFNMQNALNDRTYSLAASATLTAVPEPLTWALMVGGFGLVGVRLRRRAIQATAA